MKISHLKRVLVLLILATFCYSTQASNVENTINAKYGFSQFDSFGNGYYKVWNDLKWGVCDANGKEIVTPAYDAIWDYKDGFAVVNMGAKWIKTTTPKGVSNLEKEENFKKIWVYDNSNTSTYSWGYSSWCLQNQFLNHNGAYVGRIHRSPSPCLCQQFNWQRRTSRGLLYRVSTHNVPSSSGSTSPRAMLHVALPHTWFSTDISLS